MEGAGRLSKGGQTMDWAVGPKAGQAAPIGVCSIEQASSVLARLPRGGALEDAMKDTVARVPEEEGTAALGAILKRALERWDLLSFLTALAAVAEFYRQAGRRPPRAYVDIAARMRQELRVTLQPHEWASLLQTLQPMNSQARP